MIAMHISEVARAIGASRAGEDVSFTGCSTDTRTLSPGSLFVALEGPHFDGHDYLVEAREAGAVAAMVHRRSADMPTVVVNDTRRGLGQLAGFWRGRFELPVIAITGSNGKTTVKEMLAAIFSGVGDVLATCGNLNNDIGVPLTLSRLHSKCRTAVIEMGANHTGEIAWLARIARPTVGVITLCGPAHLEGFGSIEAVAYAKGELFENLDRDGVAVVNADDAYADLWRRLAGARRRLSFGLEQVADITASWRGIDGGSELEVTTPAGNFTMELSLPGRHNVQNALAATAAAFAAGASLEVIRSGLASVESVHGRLEFKPGPNGSTLIDDTYNANPHSLLAGLEVLAASSGRRWLVLGDMAELGKESKSYHQEVAALARTHGVERIYATGRESRISADEFGEGAQFHPGHETLVNALRADLDADVTLLVKGSRSMRLERVIAALAQASDY